MRVIDLIEDIAYVSQRFKDRNAYSDEDIARYTWASLSRRDLADYLQSSIGPDIRSYSERLLAMVARMAEIICLQTPSVVFAVGLPDPLAACAAPAPSYARRFDLESFPSGCEGRKTIALSSLCDTSSAPMDNLIGVVRDDRPLREILEFLFFSDAGRQVSALILAPNDLIERYAGFWSKDPTTHVGPLLQGAERAFGYIHAFRRNHRD